MSGFADIKGLAATINRRQGLGWTATHHDEIGLIGRAAFSPCMTYRYGLLREWNAAKERALFIMLNPSTADESVLDPTVTRCLRRAQEWGCGSMMVANLFALRSTDPAALKTHPDPVGTENDRWIAALAMGADRVVCGWGEHGKLHGRAASVVTLLRALRVPLSYLRLNKSGEPAHPLYLSYSLPLTPWRAKEAE